MRKTRVYKEFIKEDIATLQKCLDEQLETLDNAVNEYKYKQIRLSEVERLEKHYLMIKEILNNKIDDNEYKKMKKYLDKLREEK